MIYNVLGKTGLRVSAAAFGAIIVMDESPENSERYVAEAIAAGVNYFDVAPSYGNAQERIGPALKQYRDGVYLACKTGRRDAAGALEELNRSLRALYTDWFDVYQLHGLSNMEELDAVFAPGGAMEVFDSAKRAGIIRNVGFSAHSETVALAALDRYPFDTVLFPMNWALGCATGWGDALAAKQSELDFGLLAIKALVRRRWRDGEERDYPKSWCKPVLSKPNEGETALAVAGMKYALTKGASVLIPPGDIAHFRFMLAHLDECSGALTKDELDLLRSEAEKVKEELIFKI